MHFKTKEQGHKKKSKLTLVLRLSFSSAQQRRLIPDARGRALFP